MNSAVYDENSLPFLIENYRQALPSYNKVIQDPAYGISQNFNDRDLLKDEERAKCHREQSAYYLTLASLGYILYQDRPELEDMSVKEMVKAVSGIDNSPSTIIYESSRAWDDSSKYYNGKVSYNGDRNISNYKARCVAFTTLLVTEVGAQCYFHLPQNIVTQAIIGASSLAIAWIAGSMVRNGTSPPEPKQPEPEVQQELTAKARKLSEIKENCVNTYDALAALKYNDPGIFLKNPKAREKAEDFLLAAVNRRSEVAVPVG